MARKGSMPKSRVTPTRKTAAKKSPANKSTAQPLKPTAQPLKPTAQPSKPTSQPSKPTSQPSKPTAQRTKPTVQRAKPAAQSLKPAAKSSPAKEIAASGTREAPWRLMTPSGQSEFLAYRDESSSPPALVVMVGKTELRYQLRCIADLQSMLKSHGDWMPLGSADEQKPAKVGTVEAWARSTDNPVKGWYGLKKGLRGRFANYVPPVLKILGLAEVEDKPRDNRMRAS